MSSYDDDMAQLTAQLKKLNDDNKRSNIDMLSKSSSAADRALAAQYKKDLANDTSTMVMTGERSGRRIDQSGKPVGAEMKKQDNGSYAPENGKKKGGIIKSKSASTRADGIAQRGKTRGKMC